MISDLLRVEVLRLLARNPTAIGNYIEPFTVRLIFVAPLLLLAGLFFLLMLLSYIHVRRLEHWFVWLQRYRLSRLVLFDVFFMLAGLLVGLLLLVL